MRVQSFFGKCFFILVSKLRKDLADDRFVFSSWMVSELMLIHLNYSESDADHQTSTGSCKTLTIKSFSCNVLMLTLDLLSCPCVFVCGVYLKRLN